MAEADGQNSTITDEEDETGREFPAVGTEIATRKGIAFYALLVLMAVLILLVIFVNVPGIRAAAGTEMTRTGWALTSYADPGGILLPVIPDAGITAGFGTDGQVRGSSGCNEYIANYTVTDYAIRISDPVRTEMNCNGTGVMEQEQEFLSDLPKVSFLRIGPDALTLFDSSGKPVLEFRAVENAIPVQRVPYRS